MDPKLEDSITIGCIYCEGPSYLFPKRYFSTATIFCSLVVFLAIHCRTANNLILTAQERRLDQVFPAALAVPFVPDHS